MLRIGTLTALVLASAGALASGLPEGAVQHDASALPWRAAPAGLPADTRVAVLEGDPAADGLFTMRLQVPAGTRLPPHWHPQPERVTVLEGRVRVGFGSTPDEHEMRSFGPGSYYVNPPRTPHFVDFPEDSVVQITTTGPWAIKPAAAPHNTEP